MPSLRKLRLREVSTPKFTKERGKETAGIQTQVYLISKSTQLSAGIIQMSPFIAATVHKVDAKYVLGG